MRKVKVGIIGIGFSGLAHLEALKRIPNVEVVAISSREQEKSNQIAAKFGIPKAYNNAKDLINDSEVEVVHNCTPNHLHFPLNCAVLEAGKHLMSEKPLALNSDQSKVLTELAEKHDVVSGVCFNYRHYPMVNQIKDEISSQKHGKVQLVYGGYLQDWCLYESDYSWRMDRKLNGPSRAIADIGSHWCDTVQYILGKKIIEVFADLKIVHPMRKKPRHQNTNSFVQSGQAETESINIDTEDYGSVLVHFEDGTQGVFTVSQVSAGRKNRLHFEIVATESAFMWDQEDPNKLWIGKRNEANKELLRDPSLLSEEAEKLTHYPGGHQEGWPDGLKNLLLDFYRTIRSNEKTASFATIDDGHCIMQLVDAILESHRTKKWIKI
ncbi:Gfo/Idh/MocA family protein [Radiobacillus sp. PE A8.2]|uniref:Gfo/Idh/MocA family protein n=1 Tax=Radiobacillus sp. PE A8.2 TaxID=3380349 RepID=UPI00388E19D8